MSCKLELNIKRDLINRNIIKSDYTIVDIEAFNSLNNTYTNHAIDNYNLPDTGVLLYNVVQTDKGEVASPNQSVLELTDELTKVYQREFLKDSNSRLIKESKSLLDLVNNKQPSILYERNNIDEEGLDDNYTDNITLISPNNESFIKENSKDVLESIMNKSNTLSEDTNDIINKTLTKLLELNTNVEIVKDDGVLEDSKMEYHSGTNTIKIPESTLYNNTTDQVVTGLLHEMWHSALGSSLSNPKTVSDRILVADITNHFNAFKRLSGESNSYGFTNIHEFVSELMSNKEFLNELKSIEDGNKSLFEKIVDSIRIFLGLKRSSELNNLVSKILSSVDTNNFGFLDGEDSNIIFQLKNEKNETERDLTTIEGRIDNMHRSLLDNLDGVVRINETFLKGVKDGANVDSLIDKNLQIKEAINMIEELEGLRKLMSVNAYLNIMNHDLRVMNKRLDSFKFNSSNSDILFNRFKRFRDSVAIIKDMNDLLEDAKLNLTPEQLKFAKVDRMAELLRTAEQDLSGITSKIKFFNKEYTINLISQPRFNTRIQRKWRDKLTKEGHSAIEVKQLMDGKYKEEIHNEMLAYARDLVQNPILDIGSLTAQLNTASNINNDFIQIALQMATTLKDNITTKSRALEFEIDELFNRYIKGKSGSADRIYGKFYEEGADGRLYLKGKYSIKFADEFNKLKKEYDKFIMEGDSEKARDMEVKMSSWMSENTKMSDDNIVPIDKYLNKEFTGLDKEVYDKAIEIFEQTNKDTYGQNTLTRKIDGVNAEFLTLPAIRKTDMERVYNKDAVGIGRERIANLKITTEDVGFHLKKLDLDNNQYNEVRVHYRGYVKAKDQTKDLFSMMLMEGINGINYKEKTENLTAFDILRETVKEKEFLQSEDGKPIKSMFNRRNDVATTKSRSNKESNTYKKINGMMETHIYDLLYKHSGTFLGADVNKLISLSNAYSGILGMSINEVSAATNVLNGSAQMFIESFAGAFGGKSFLSTRSMAKAQRMYIKDQGNIILDSGRPIHKSFTNQLMDEYDTWGLVTVSNMKSFFKNNMFKNNASLKSLMVMQTTGEHWMQSVITMSVLDGVKVMNDKGQFIDRNGKVVKEENKAASLLDMYSNDPNTGKLVLNKNVAYTTHTPDVSINDGGKVFINMLIKQKLYDMIGNYTKDMQSEMYKTGVGRLMFMFKKYLIPMYMTRVRGLKYVNKETSELTDDQRFFNQSLQEFDEGNYTTVARYMIQSLKDMILERKITALTRYKDMTPAEKANFNKGVAEIGVIVSLMLSIPTVVAIADEKDTEAAHFAALQSVRLLREVRSFLNPVDQWKVIKSPFVMVNNIEAAIKLSSNLMIWNWNDRDQQGELKLKKNTRAMIPVLNVRNSTYKQKINFIVSQSNIKTTPYFDNDW